ncbi:MAG: peptidyl-prolyl cis-trans isomerase C [Myxococcota bacterium]|jgi:peptidyl-prolyl cis-trans isomerase C
MSWLKDPLFHFIVAGAALYAAGTVMQNSSAIEEPVIVLTASEAASDQREQLVADRVLYHEALRLGVGQDDVVVRRRLVQKMRFLLGDLATASEPTEVDLQQWFGAHETDYRRADRVSLRHRFFSSERRGQAAHADARSALDDLTAESDPFIHGASGRNVDLKRLRGWFGDTMAQQLMSLGEGEWSEPLRSTYGWHLVTITGRSGSTALRWDTLAPESRAQVRADWLSDQRAVARRRALAEAKSRYRVVVE